MRRTALDEFDRPWLVLCEGPTDRIIIQKLLKLHRLEENYTVRSVMGRSQISGAVEGMRLSESFIQNVKAILILADKDDDPVASFAEVQTELEKCGFPVPASENEVAEREGSPKIIVLMVPIRGNGNLETLAILAMDSKWSLKNKIDNFIQQTPASDWPLSKKSKSQVEIMLAVTCKSRPDTTFAGHWDEPQQYHLPIEHDCFEEYVRYFQNFGILIGGA